MLEPRAFHFVSVGIFISAAAEESSSIVGIVWASSHSTRASVVVRMLNCAVLT